MPGTRTFCGASKTEMDPGTMLEAFGMTERVDRELEDAASNKLNRVS